MKRALITTTIHRPDNLVDWHAQLRDGDVVIVAGDLKTPHNEVREVLKSLPGESVYLHPGEDSHQFQTHAVVGYNTIQRRNLALLEAITHQPDYIITVDDDNYPSVQWVDAVDRILTGETVDDAATVSVTGWWNPGQLCHPVVTHRGFPLSERNHSPRTERMPAYSRVGVFASLWTDDPDIDAIERIVYDPFVTSVSDEAVVLAAGTWAPFNSQATAFRAELAPLMLMWPGCQRYDDIWASYCARTVMDVLDWRVRYGQPTVRQLRNPHDLVHDMEEEMLGYRYTSALTLSLRRIGKMLSHDMSVAEATRYVYAQLIKHCPFLPAQTLRGFDAWVSDLTTVGVK